MPIGFSLNFTTPEEAVDFTSRMVALVSDFKALLGRIFAQGQRIESRLVAQNQLLQQVVQKLDLAIQAGADPVKLAELSGKMGDLKESVTEFADTETKS